MIDLKTQNMLLRAPALRVKASISQAGLVEGYASTFGGEPDRQGDVVLPGAFGRSLDLHRREKTAPAMLWQHRLEEPVGRWTDLHEDAQGLAVSGQLNMKTERGREAFEHVAAGDVGALSIGYAVPEGGRQYRGDGVFSLSEIDLHEVSIVTIPANPRARITAAKSFDSKNELVDALREMGLSRAASARVAAGGWPALAGADDRRAHEQKAAELIALVQDRTARILKGF